MQRDEIRLECIKIAASKTTDHSDALKRAEDFFGFVMKLDVLEKEVVKAEKHFTKNANIKSLT